MVAPLIAVDGVWPRHPDADGLPDTTFVLILLDVYFKLLQPTALSSGGGLKH